MPESADRILRRAGRHGPAGAALESGGRGIAAASLAFALGTMSRGGNFEGDRRLDLLGGAGGRGGGGPPAPRP